MTLLTASATCSGGTDAVPLEETAEPEELAVGGGELFLELADRGSPRVAFAAEFLGEDVHDVAAVRAFRAGFQDRTGSLLVPELLDAGAEVIVAVEEVEADPGGGGDGPEVNVLLVLDERADRGFGAVTAACRLACAAWRSAAARRSSALPVTVPPVSG
jgi:hypothetical protein